MKKFFKYLGFGLLSVIVFLIGIVVITSMGSVDKDEVFPPFIAESVPKLTTWDIEEYKPLISERGMESATPEQWGFI